MTNTYDAIIIGAGHNGLVTAAYLAQAGQRVLVLERRDVIGGAAATEEIFPGYSVDIGSHKLGGFSQTIMEDLQLVRHGLEVVPADPSIFTPSLEGPALLLWRDPARTVAAIREISQADAAAWMGFAQLLDNATALLQAAWTTIPPNLTGSEFGDLWSSLKLGMQLRRLGKKDMVEVMRILPMSVSELLGDWFENDLVKGTLAAAAITGLFQGPMAAGTVYTLLHHHVGAGTGVVRPTVKVRGGMGRLIDAVTNAAKEAGAEVRVGRSVERILVEQGSAVGVRLSRGEEIRGARVISNADPRSTFLSLVDPGELGPDFVGKVRNIRFKGACAKVHLAVGELPNFTCVTGNGSHLSGVISISPSLEYLERAYDDAKYGNSSEQPYLEVSIPSVADPSVAPAGKHLVSIVVQYAPYALEEGGWDDRRREALGDTVVRTLCEYAPNVASSVEQRHVMTPLDLEQTFGLTEGNIYHGEMMLDQLFFMRPVPGYSRYRTPIGNLYMCGAGVHPGGGVTGVPGFNAAREVLRDSR